MFDPFKDMNLYTFTSCQSCIKIGNPQEYKAKIIMPGDKHVGRTSLIHQLTGDKFKSTFKPSLGVDFVIRNKLIDDKLYKVLFFVTAEEEFMSDLRKRYYAGAAAALIVFDLTNPRSFENISKHLEEIENEIGKVFFCIIGNKLDLIQVAKQEISRKERAETLRLLNENYPWKIPYLEISCKTGENLDKLNLLIDKLVIMESLRMDLVKMNSSEKDIRQDASLTYWHKLGTKSLPDIDDMIFYLRKEMNVD